LSVAARLQTASRRFVGLSLLPYNLSAAKYRKWPATYLASKRTAPKLATPLLVRWGVAHCGWLDQAPVDNNDVTGDDGQGGTDQATSDTAFRMACSNASGGWAPVIR
jgi:hypothetical protein